MERRAVIDLGTNTFNLLVADLNAHGLRTVATERIAVLIGMGGINSGVIAADAMERAKNALTNYCAKARELGATSITGFGTSALRDASNADELLQFAKEQLDLEIHVISGMKEAELIYNGVRWAYDFSAPALIMDIGGGSTEFIHADKKGAQKAVSLDIGVSRIYQELGKPKNYSTADLDYIVRYLSFYSNELTSLKGPKILIGASGTFETFFEMLFRSNFGAPNTLRELPAEELTQILDWCIHASYQERKDHPWLIDIRKSMMPIAALKVKWVMEQLEIKRVFVSPYSLKEGALNTNIL